MLIVILLTCSQIPDPPANDRLPFMKSYSFPEAIKNRPLTIDSGESLKYLYQTGKMPRSKFLKLFRERGSLMELQSALIGTVDPGAEPQSVRSSLNKLKRHLSPEDYKAGKLPPPVPAEYRKEFEAWRAKIIEDDKQRKRPKD